MRLDWAEHKELVEIAGRAIDAARWQGIYTSRHDGLVEIQGGDCGIIIDAGGAAYVAIEALLAAGYRITKAGVA